MMYELSKKNLNKFIRKVINKHRDKNEENLQKKTRVILFYYFTLIYLRWSDDQRSVHFLFLLTR